VGAPGCLGSPNIGATVTIASYVGFNGACDVGVREGRSFHIGEAALVAGGVTFDTSDLHSVFDLDTGERINHAADIVIGKHVWLGARVTVLKGVTIGEGCVVGAAAVVTKDIPPHCLAVGAPARVVRERIAWDHRLLDRMPRT
jgi:acetyltransferase-like isoleucine patch superfamily enzyme